MNARPTRGAIGLGTDFDSHDFGRPARHSRPRTKQRPAHEDAVLGRVVAVDRGRYTLVVQGRHVIAMRARELGRKSVVVGDVELDARLAELVRAAREAMWNAAKHSGAPRIDVYAEAEDGHVEVFVRDRGHGFDLDSVPEDRHGLRGSIVERMGRHHGTARITSDPDRGTEVSLEMKR